MSVGKKGKEGAWYSFHTSDMWNPISLKLGGDGLPKARELYFEMYDDYPTEDELNKAYADFVNLWADPRNGYRGKKDVFGRAYGIDKAYKDYKKQKEKASGNSRPSQQSVTAQDAEAMSRPGSRADKGIGNETGVDVEMAQRMAEEEAKKKDKKKGWDITPDDSLSTAEDAKAQAVIIKGITRVGIDPNNAHAAYDAYKNIYDSGNMSDALKCKQAAENIEAIRKKTRMLGIGPKKWGVDKEESKKIEYYWGYASKIADSEDGIFGGDHFGVDKEKDLENRYKEAEKQTANLNGNDAEAVMSLMKLLADDMELELQWQETVKTNGMKDKLLKSQARHVDMDTSRGYGAMWKKASSFVNPLVQNHLQAAAEAYLKHTPWSADDDIFPGAGITYRDFFTKSKELFDNRQKAREQGDWMPELPGENDTSSNTNDKKKTKTSTVVESPDEAVDATGLGRNIQSGQEEKE